MVRKSWDEFRETGLLCFVNTFLHMFGWAIVICKDNDELEVFPARVNYSGFSEESYEKNYKKVKNLLKEDLTQFEQVSED